MQSKPFLHQFYSTPRHFTFANIAIKAECGLVACVFGMEMGRAMIARIHHDHNAVKTAENWHLDIHIR